MTHIAETNRLAEFALLRRGKVRDVYEIDADRLLLVATDRISAFDCILPNPIPGKGQVLTQISRFWFNRFRDLVPHHMLAGRLADFPADVLARLGNDSRAWLAGRSTLAMRTEVVPFECVARGYLAGSGWKDYQKTGSVCGHALPPGLRESDRLPRPLFTPATKAEEGHDINVSIAEMAATLGAELTGQLESISLRLYAEAAAYAAERGIIICDTKFEFGLRDGRLLLIDEALTPDSSRFWPRDQYAPGGPQPSFDKQYVRDYLETLDWNKQYPAPELPQAVIAATREKYLGAFARLTGHSLDDELREELTPLVEKRS
ncbi:MAG: phosphoribosylaminoimidazolesuccinocarboxamide synthase [Blastocatellia bacterium]